MTKKEITIQEVLKEHEKILAHIANLPVGMSGASQKKKEKNEFKKGDKVWYGTSIYSIDKFRGKDDRIAEISNDTTAIDVWTKDLTPIKVAPTVQQELELTGEDESINLNLNNGSCVNLNLYCSCVLPNLKKNMAYGSSFYICLDCKKEKI